MKVKDSIIDANNRLNGIFNLFNPFNSEFPFGNRLIDIFPSYFSFHLSDRKYAKVKTTHLYKLDEPILHISVDLKTTIVVSDASIKNQVAMSIIYIHIYDTPVVKIIYYIVNITSTEAKLFVIRCGLN